MSISVLKLGLASGAEVYVADCQVIHAIGIPNVWAGQDLAPAAAYKRGDVVTLKDGSVPLVDAVVRTGQLHLGQSYQAWLADIDALAMRFAGEVNFTARSGALKAVAPWVELYVDGLTPEEAWDEQTVSA